MDEKPSSKEGKRVLRALLGRDIPPPDKPGHWSSYTHVVTCALCGNQFTTHDWIWGTHRFTATICTPCSDRWDARRGDWPKPPKDEREIRSPLPKEDY